MGQRPARRRQLRLGGSRRQRLHPRYRRWPGAGGQVHREPRQAAPSGSGLGCGATGAAGLNLSPMATDFTEETAAGAVVDSFAKTPDPRLRELLSSLVRHLHAFVRETEPTIAEWERAIGFLTATGQKCDDERQEFILLSDVLGISMLVETINNRKTGGATESTVLGPFHMIESPRRELGELHRLRRDGHAVRRPRPGPVRRTAPRSPAPSSTSGRPTTRGSTTSSSPACSPGPTAAACSRPTRTAASGSARSCRATTRSPPTARSATLLIATERHPYRPAHIHFIVTAPGHRALTTHIFVAGSPYIESDAVFAVKKSLIKEFTPVDDAEQAAGTAWTGPFCLANFDIVLQPASGKLIARRLTRSSVTPAPDRASPSAATRQGRRALCCQAVLPVTAERACDDQRRSLPHHRRPRRTAWRCATSSTWRSAGTPCRGRRSRGRRVGLPPVRCCRRALQLFALSFLMLFVELALIRWSGALVIYLSYFSNFVLLGSFLGIGIGFLRARARVNLFPWAPVALALLILFVRVFPVEVVRTGNAGIIFFGYGSSTPAARPPGSRCPSCSWPSPPSWRRSARASPGRSSGSARWTPTGSTSRAASPASRPSRCCRSWTPSRSSGHSSWRGHAAGSTAGGSACSRSSRWPAVVLLLWSESLSSSDIWSPYYRISVDASGPGQYSISVNGIPHQNIIPARELQKVYSQPYLDAPANPLRQRPDRRRRHRRRRGQRPAARGQAHRRGGDRSPALPARASG